MEYFERKLSSFPEQHKSLCITAGAGILSMGIGYQMCDTLVRDSSADNDTVNKQGKANIPSPRPAPKESDPSCR